jgi:very-short-patch-repair endonuclease
MTHDREQRDFARELRRRMNAVESALWERLRNRRQCHFKFRRQHPLGPYVADFWCPVAKVVVELDGVTHRERKTRDEARDAWMSEQGVLVLRFENRELDESIETVLNRINETCRSRIS